MSLRLRYKEYKARKKQAKLADANKLATNIIQVPLENRLAELKESGANVLIRVYRASGGDHGMVSKQYYLSDIDPETFQTQLAEDYGGGAYRTQFLIDGKMLMLKSDPSTPESYSFRISGPTKAKRSESEDKVVKLLSSDLVKALTPFVPQIITYFSGKGMTLDKLADVLVKLKQLSPEPPSYDPISQINDLMGVIEKIAQQVKPPVTTSPMSSGFWDRLATAAAPALAGIFSGAMQGQPGQPAAAGALPAANQPLQLSQPMTVNPLMVLKALIERRTDPNQVAQYAIDAIDTYAKFSYDNIPAAWRTLLGNPEGAIEQLALFLPELKGDPDYLTRLKIAAVGYVNQWKEDQDQGQPEPEPKLTKPPEPEIIQPPAEDQEDDEDEGEQP